MLSSQYMYPAKGILKGEWYQIQFFNVIMNLYILCISFTPYFVTSTYFYLQTFAVNRENTLYSSIQILIHINYRPHKEKVLQNYMYASELFAQSAYVHTYLHTTRVAHSCLHPHIHFWYIYTTTASMMKIIAVHRDQTAKNVVLSFLRKTTKLYQSRLKCCALYLLHSHAAHFTRSCWCILYI